MGEIGTGPYRDGEYEGGHRAPRDGRPRPSQPAPGERPRRRDLDDAEAERLLDGPWALHIRTLDPVDGTAAGSRDHAPKPTDLPDLGITAVAGRSARVAYSAGWDGADDPSGHAGARGTAGYQSDRGTPGVRVPDPGAAGDPWRPDRPAGSPDSGGEMTVSSVDFPVDLASPEAQAVARLLAAATAPPRPHELRGYDSARRAFERAGSAPARRGALVPLRRLIGVKAAAVAGALTVTGVAVAAEADVLPSPIQRVAHQMLGGVGVPDSEPDPTASTPVAGRSSSSGTRPGSPHPTGSAALGTAAGPGGGIPAPGTPTGTGGAPGTAASTGGNADVLALCRAFVAQQAGTGGALSGHDKHTLAGLAGGEDKIAEFCARALATAPAQSSVPSEQPTGPSDGKGSSSAPSPSRDHKPTDTAPPTTPPAAPPSSGPDGTDNGHGHTTPNPTRTPHLNKS